MAIHAGTRNSVPVVVLDMQDGLSHLNCSRICPEHYAGDVAAAQCRWEAAIKQVQDGIDWLVSAPEIQIAKLTELQSQLDALKKQAASDVSAAQSEATKAKSKTANLRESADANKARATHFEQIARDLQQANLDRPETSKIANLAVLLMVGLRYVQWVADSGDINRQTVCGMDLLCKSILAECGAVADVNVDLDSVMRIMTGYYANLSHRDIDALKAWGNFHSQVPQR